MSDVTQRVLSASEVQEVLEERILHGTYLPGSRLPSVRHIASELGVSPSTVSRALQGVERREWIRMVNRKGAIVARRLPQKESTGSAFEVALRRMAVRWQLLGRSREGLADLTNSMLDDVFRVGRSMYFVECNSSDLADMTEQLEGASSTHVTPVLLADLRTTLSQPGEAMVLTPYFHLAEVQSMRTERATIVPLNFIPSVEIMTALANVPPSSTIAVIAKDKRSQQHLHGIAHQYSLAPVRSTTADQVDEARQMVRNCQVVFTARAAMVPDDILSEAQEVLMCRFTLESDVSRLHF